MSSGMLYAQYTVKRADDRNAQASRNETREQNTKRN
jgi:hypothetical protein